MAFVPLMACFSDLFGVQTMLPLGMKSHFSHVLIGSAVLNFTMLALLTHFTHFFAEQDAAATVLIVETSIASAMAFTLHLQGVLLLRRSVAAPGAGLGPGRIVHKLSGLSL